MRSFRTLRRTGLAFAALAAAASVTAVSFGTPASAAPRYEFTKVSGAAADAAGLQATVDNYRALLGEPNNGSNPPAAAGRREINWDGTPDAQSDPNLLPPDFFNTTVPRGAEFATKKGNKFLVSADNDNPTKTKPLFGNVNPQYDDIFATFSPQRLFTPLKTPEMTVKFFVPGTKDRATVKGFGAVFVDVDRKNSSKIELFDRHGKKLYSAYVPKAPVKNKGLSFLGIKTNADVYEVRLTVGTDPLNKNNKDGRWKDIVAMDDFLYAEPQKLH
ncbi:hypothetical protein Val02_01380 [Virgisporangium aliadipatigenens]|uniref:Uncharacterized protein n=1 Tax=Virgisporangium aliadipatigenens TaxID=741659 RepID=A0A8J3YFD5_9ACTN|nr:hypothetical protein [Virgisporangium aliadipatigenens]GIJ43252.1 hypothetical protein Val02_01380 [Virgisporangium aliadipatigenens]